MKAKTETTEWYTLKPFEVSDAIEKEELSRERVRIACARYGLLSRATLSAEEYPFTWENLLPAIRAMELSGELVWGRFFEGIEGVQFMHSDAVKIFEEMVPGKMAFSLNATDPASIAGQCASYAKAEGFPSRLRSTHIGFSGGRIAAVSYRSFRELEVFISPDDPDFSIVCGFLVSARKRAVYPEKKIVVETVNGKSSARSEYRKALESLGFEADRNGMVMW